MNNHNDENEKKFEEIQNNHRQMEQLTQRLNDVYSKKETSINDFNGKMMVKEEMIENLTKDLNQICGETIELKNHYESEIDQRKAHEECIYEECDKRLRQNSILLIEN